MGFLPSEIARLVLGYLADEGCKEAYASFLNSSPSLSECRERNFTYYIMGYSLVDILNEYGALQILLNSCKSPVLRMKLKKYPNNLEKIAFLLESVACDKSEKDFESITLVEFEHKSTDTDDLIEVPVKHCIENGKQFETDVATVVQNGILPVLPEISQLKREADIELEVEQQPVFVADVKADGSENNFMEMLKPGTIVSTENLSKVPIEVVYLETDDRTPEHEQNSLLAEELTMEHFEKMNTDLKKEQSEIDSDRSDFSLNVGVSDSESETNCTADSKLEFKCYICNEVYEKKEELENHINFSHDFHSQRNVSTPKDIINDTETPRAEDIGQVYICALCDKLFKKRYYLIEHIQNTHERNWKKCTKCNAEFLTRYQLYTHTKNVHKLSNSTNEHKCERCNRTFTLKYLYRLHMSEVHAANDKKFQCKHCTRKYPTELKLRKHVRYMHTDNGEYRCEFCPKIYLSKVQLARHKQYSHSKDGSIVKCQHCRKTFGSLKQLARHTKEVHQSFTMKFDCQICSVSFRIRKDLVDHCMSKHSVKFPELYSVLCPVEMKCSQCDTAFKSERQLENHYKKTHEDGVKCKVCVKTFATKFRMETHMRRSHSVNGQTFVCLKCMKVFETKYQLTSHTALVHGEKTFCCQICSKAFSLKRSLTRHLTEVHDKKKKLKKRVARLLQ